MCKACKVQSHVPDSSAGSSSRVDVGDSPSRCASGRSPERQLGGVGRERVSPGPAPEEELVAPIA